MIIDIIRADILSSGEPDICFAVNMEGANDAGFAGQVCRYWPELATLVPMGYGDVLHKRVKMGDEIVRFHAICCHNLGPGGWNDAPGFIEAGLNSLTPALGQLSIVLMGAGMIGKMQGADVLANLGAIARAKSECRVYTL